VLSTGFFTCIGKDVGFIGWYVAGKTYMKEFLWIIGKGSNRVQVIIMGFLLPDEYRILV
jgi:hypothetical protein